MLWNEPRLNGSSCFPLNPQLILKGNPGQLEYAVRTCLKIIRVAQEVEEVPDPVVCPSGGFQAPSTIKTGLGSFARSALSWQLQLGLAVNQPTEARSDLRGQSIE
jgi:hypothetical protein